MRHRSIARMLPALLLLAAGPVAAQMALTPETGSLVGTFTAACVTHAGNSAAIAAWAIAHALPELGAEATATFVGPGGGRAWSVSTAGRRRVLVAPTDGRCRILAEKADALAAQEALLAALRRDGVSVTVDPARTAADGTYTLREYHASVDGRSWQLGIASRIRPEDPEGQPAVAMTAMATMPVATTPTGPGRIATVPNTPGKPATVPAAGPVAQTLTGPAVVGASAGGSVAHP